MELIDRFNTASWVSSDLGKHKDDFMPYTIIRAQLVKPGCFKYAVREIRDDDEGGDPLMQGFFSLEGSQGKKDPLASVRNCDLFLKEGQVVGVALEGECVVRKDTV